MNHRKRFAASCLVSLLTISLVFPAYGTKTDVDEAKKKASSLEEQKKQMENTLRELEGIKSDTASYVKALDSKLEAYEKQIKALSSQMSVKEAEIQATREDLELAQETEEKQYRDMKLRIQYMYERGETSYLDLLFESENLTQLFYRTEYIQAIASYDREMLLKYKDTKAQVEAREAELVKEQEELASLKSSAEARQQDIQTLVDEKTAELKKYQGQINTAQGNLSELERDIAAQEDKIKAMEAEIKRKEEEARKAALAAGQKYNTVSIGNISFIWPCPASRRITSGYGGRDAPMEGASSSHQGIDIGAPTGSSIQAAASGTVTIATYSYSAGNYIMVNHGGGVSTVYMHCSELLVSPGQTVTQGQVIAKVGSTGYSTGPHLHFGIRVNGSYVNPTKYVSP